MAQERDFNFHPQCKQLKLTHLLFAYDLILFCKAGRNSLQHFMNALHHFHECASLKINLQKSQIVFEGISHALRTECLHTTRLKEGCFPLKYLGVPITASKLIKLECRSLLEKITTRVQIWASRNLSFAGRAVLINNVLFGMFTYCASIFILPYQVIDNLSRICRNGLWRGSAESRIIPHVAWYQVCLSKTQGGLRLKDHNAWNKALIGKLVSIVAYKKDILWVKWIHGRYMKNQAWWDYSLSLN